jgi:predicted nucleotidyltransferase
MVTTRQQALEIAAKARRDLDALYGDRLRGVYLCGSGARDQLTPDSDIDIAVILAAIPNRFAEHERTIHLGADLSLKGSSGFSVLRRLHHVPRPGKPAPDRVAKRNGSRLGTRSGILRFTPATRSTGILPVIRNHGRDAHAAIGRTPSECGPRSQGV